MSVAVNAGAGLSTCAAPSAETQPAANARNKPSVFFIVFCLSIQNFRRPRWVRRPTRSPQSILLLQGFVQRIENDPWREVTIRQNDRRLVGIPGINQHQWHGVPPELLQLLADGFVLLRKIGDQRDRVDFAELLPDRF